MSSEYTRAGFLKRIFAIVYDLFAVVALLMLATVITLVVLHVLTSLQWFVLPAGMEPSAFLNSQWWFKVELLLVIWTFYAWFWHDGGQTLGMRTWRLKVVTEDFKPLSLKTAYIRAATALLGLGNIAVLIQPSKKLALQDRVTKTQVIMLSKEQNKQVYLRGVEPPPEHKD